MGAWGTAIFSDDVAADVRDEFKTLLGDGLSAEEATAQMTKEYRPVIADSDDGPVFWLALAATQWSLGRLLPDVLERALRIIDSGDNLRRWEAEDPKQAQKRATVLANLRSQLTSPMPDAKKVTKRFRDANDWRVGTIVSYRLPSGDLCAIRVIGHHEDKGGRSVVVEALDWQGAVLPSRWALWRLKVRQPVEPHRPTQFMIGAGSAREFPAERVEVTSIRLKRSQKPDGYTALSWRSLDKELAEIYGFR